jgi:hypothetical protein
MNAPPINLKPIKSDPDQVKADQVRPDRVRPDRVTADQPNVDRADVPSMSAAKQAALTLSIRARCNRKCYRQSKSGGAGMLRRLWCKLLSNAAAAV